MVPSLSADGVDMLLKEQHDVVLTRLCRLARKGQEAGPQKCLSPRTYTLATVQVGGPGPDSGV